MVLLFLILFFFMNFFMLGFEWLIWFKVNVWWVNVFLFVVSFIFFYFIFLDLSILKKKLDDYFNVGYGCIIMVFWVKFVYDWKVWDIIYFEWRNFIVIRGYKCIGGLLDDFYLDL